MRHGAVNCTPSRAYAVGPAMRRRKEKMKRAKHNPRDFTPFKALPEFVSAHPTFLSLVKKYFLINKNYNNDKNINLQKAPEEKSSLKRKEEDRWIYSWNMKTLERWVQDREENIIGWIGKIFLWYNAFVYNGGSFNIKIAFAWHRDAGDADGTFPSFHVTDFVRAELRAEHFNPIVNNLQTETAMGTSKLLSQITRERAVILKDCPFQTDVFNLTMQVPFHFAVQRERENLKASISSFFSNDKRHVSNSSTRASCSAEDILRFCIRTFVQVLASCTNDRYFFHE